MSILPSVQFRFKSHLDDHPSVRGKVSVLAVGESGATIYAVIFLSEASRGGPTSR
jgi:hypothetical protein